LYLVAGFSGGVVAASLAGLVLRAGARLFAALAVVASLLAFAIAGYNATGYWEGVGARTLEDTFVNLDGDVRLELIALTIVAAVPAILGAIVWSILPRAEPDDLDDEEVTTEDAEVWA
jgi:hypothetical protein